MTERLLSILDEADLEAGAAVEATRSAEAHVGPIHLLVTDVVMPDMDGQDLVLRTARPRTERSRTRTSRRAVDSARIGR